MWRGQDGICANGLAFEIAFEMRSLNVTLPDAITYTVTFNTSHTGSVPSGPYDSLNVGLCDFSRALPTVGTDYDGGKGIVFADGLPDA